MARGLVAVVMVGRAVETVEGYRKGGYWWGGANG